MNGPRRSYEARVLLVPLGSSADRLATAMAEQGLDGIETLADRGAGNYAIHPLGAHGWNPEVDVVDSALDIVAAADMVVLLASDLSEVEPSVCAEVAWAAQDSGVLIAALVVGSEHWDTPSGNTAMASLREAVDMLVIVRSLRMATPFLDVLRGGRRSSPSAV